MNHLFLHCRAGFEKECAAEIQDLATAVGVYGYPKTREGRGYVIYVTHEPEGALELVGLISFREMIFARQWFVTQAPLADLPATNRVGPLLALAQTLPAVRSLVAETPDTNEGKELSTLAKKLTAPFSSALKKAGCVVEDSPWQLHLVLISGQCAYLGISPVNNRAAWSMGIPRLRQPRDAPSRATLKLEEAWHHFVPAYEWDSRLAGGQRAVDLGAAPGGWTQVAAAAVGDGGRVIASDILPMDPVAGAEFIVGDFTEETVFQALLEAIGEAPVDLVISDMAPNMSGMAAVDQPAAMYLIELALDMARSILKPGGGLVAKVFHGEGFDDYLKAVRQDFSRVVMRKPRSSRARSRETYLVAQGFRG